MQYLCIMIGGRRLAVDVANIIEIINPASEKYSDAGIAADEKSLSYQGKKPAFDPSGRSPFGKGKG